jgi:hypothetical protein
MIVLGFVCCCCRDSKPSNNSTSPDNDGVLFLGEETYSPTDTVYPILITDSTKINRITNLLRNKFVPQEDFEVFNLEEGKYYLLGKFLIVNCMLVGPSGWASNFSQFFIIDVKNHRNVHIMSLSNNINNFFLSDNLIVNSIEYPDKFFYDAEFFDNFFKEENTTFKLINTTIETDSLSTMAVKESEKTIKWKDVYDYLVPNFQ